MTPANLKHFHIAKNTIGMFKLLFFFLLYYGKLVCYEKRPALPQKFKDKIL